MTFLEDKNQWSFLWLSSGLRIQKSKSRSNIQRNKKNGLVKLSIQKPINNTFKNYKPGNLNVSTFFPFNSKYSTSFRDWVLFPQRSHPSNTIIHPLAQTDIFSLFPTNFPRQYRQYPEASVASYPDCSPLISKIGLQPTCSPKFRKAGHERTPLFSPRSTH